VSAKPETSFIAGVHKHLPPGREDPYWMKNNNIYTAGIWDVWYSGAAADLWIEYKFEVLPKRPDTLVPIQLSALQEDWGRKRLKEGRNLAVIVGCKEGGVIFQDLEWESEITQAAFKARIMSRADIARWIMQQTMPQALRKRA
jgi:hypothetical protein